MVDKSIDIKWIQNNLKIYGYAIEETGELDDQTKAVLQTYQMHFRPTDYSGVPDQETCAILDNLVRKYFPDQALKRAIKIEDFNQSPVDTTIYPSLFKLKT